MLRQEIERIIAPLKGKIGLTIRDRSGQLFGVHEDEPLQAASVIKLPIMAAAFALREAGKLDFSARVRIRAEDKMPSCGVLTYLHDGLEVTVRDLITLMIIVSDNSATNLVIDLLGLERIEQEFRKMGLEGSVLRRKLFDEDASRRGIQNTVTAAEMGRILEQILQGTLVSRTASEEMLHILLDQQLNGKIPFYLHSRDIEVAHKTGEDDGITNDVGILMTDPPVIFCFLSNETEVPQTERAIQDIARYLAGV